MIPCPKTLEDFNTREFAPDDYVYSSFAYLIGAVHGISTAVSKVRLDPLDGSSPGLLEAVDTMINGWLLLVPESKANIYYKRGETDELVLYPLEIISSCATNSANSWPQNPPWILKMYTPRAVSSLLKPKSVSWPFRLSRFATRRSQCAC